MPFKLPKGLDPDAPWNARPFAAFDTETTGIPGDSPPVEVAIIHFSPEGEMEESWSTLINPGISIPAGASKVHGIKDQHVKDAPVFADVYDEIVERMKGRVPLVFNLPYDYQILKNAAERIGQKWFAFFGVDALPLARHFLPGVPGRKPYAQANLVRHYGLHEGERDHRAEADVINLGRLFFQVIANEFRDESPTLQELWTMQVEAARKFEKKMAIKYRRGSATGQPWHEFPKEVSR